ncbi:hypothetical protein NPIL_153581 [Nephila pilipes]|uniref:Uncharacterized protein n=1 Tax=Nephila pilipes TaxID=299642 RepID=A0A8X6NAD0_NEPPI|nr:hypothetical protein NPIL_153581 [Nephila pilipes]
MGMGLVAGKGSSGWSAPFGFPHLWARCPVGLVGMGSCKGPGFPPGWAHLVSSPSSLVAHERTKRAKILAGDTVQGDHLLYNESPGLGQNVPQLQSFSSVTRKEPSHRIQATLEREEGSKTIVN